MGNDLANALDNLGLEDKDEPIRTITNINWSQKQLDVFDFVKNGNGNAVVEAVAGCLSGNTMIGVNRARKSYQQELKKLVHLFNGGKLSGKYHNPNISTKVRSLVHEDIIGLNNVKAAISSGEKLTYAIATESGHYIRATAKHKFLTPDGWKELGDLTARHRLMVDVGKSSGNTRKKKLQYRRITGMEHHPYHHHSKPHKCAWVHRLVAEAQINHLFYEEFTLRIKSGKTEGLKFLDPEIYIVHHIDGNTYNNNINNLKVMTKEEHLSYHAINDGWKNVQASVVGSKIKFIRKYGVESTFDLTMEDSSQQNFLANGIVVHNSGKTTTIVEALNYTDPNADVAFVAFAKRNAEELRERSPDHVHVSTTHSLGLRNIKRTFPKSKVDTNKMWKLFDIYKQQQSFRDKDLLKNNVGIIFRLVSLLKAVLLDPTDNNLDYIADHYSVNTNGQHQLVYKAAKKLYTMSLEDVPNFVNYDDMIFASAYGIVESHKFDFLFVDEAQDLNASQIQFVLNSVKSTGRVIAVGDRFQSIFGFRGADTEAIPNLIQALEADTLPLTITYRCPTSVVKLAQKFVPHLEAREDAPEGIVKTIGLSSMSQLVKEGDLVICRVNAPLVPPAFALIRKGIKAVILGREIGTGLVNLIDRVGKRNMSSDVVSLLGDMSAYATQEVTKLTAAKKHSRALTLQDQFNTIVALADGCQEISEIKQKIRQVFDDNRKGVTFSSVHKIKGGEAKRVFILNPSGMPHPMAKSDWEMVQEQNIIYVAYTRAIEELYFVE